MDPASKSALRDFFSFALKSKSPPNRALVRYWWEQFSRGMLDTPAESRAAAYSVYESLLQMAGPRRLPPK